MKCSEYQELIALYVEGDLSQVRVKEIEEHLKLCADCSAFAAQLKESQSALKQLGDDSGSDAIYQQIRQRVHTRIQEKGRTRSSIWVRALLVAASIAVLAVAGTIVVSRKFSTETVQPQVVFKRAKNSPQTFEPNSKPQSVQMEDAKTKGHEAGKTLLADMSHEASESVVVTGETPLVDSKKKSTSSTYAHNYLSDVPTARDPWSYDGVDTADGSATGSTPTYYDFDSHSEIPAGSGGQASGQGTLTYQLNQPVAPPATELPVAEPPSIDTTQIQTADELLVLQQNPNAGEARRRLLALQEPARRGSLRASSVDGEFVGDFPLRHTEVTADISGYLARTIVEQQYTNPYNEVIEAVYVFPLPVMSAVNDFVMEVRGRRIVGVVRPREEAERIYREARERGQTASLLTQERPNTFTQNVANIEPGGTVNIKITYFERLPYEKGHYEYVFPMVAGPRYIPGNAQAAIQGKESGGGWAAPTDQVPDADKITPPVLKPGERSGYDIGVTIRLDAGLPISDLQCVTHKMKVEKKDSDARVLKLVQSDSIPNRDLVLRWSVAGDRIQFGVLAHRGKEAGFFTLLMQPPLEPSDNQVSPREITFILDVSGSMSGIPVEMSKQIVHRTLDRLRPEDIFNIFYFANGNGQLWNSPQPNTRENIAAAKAFLESLQGAGGTEMLAGVQRALASLHDPKYLQMYMFLTDGEVGNEAEILRLIHEKRGEARFFAFGIGSSVNRYLIDGIGEYGGGVSHVVIPRDRNHAQHAADQFFECIDSPVLVDISIDWNGLPVTGVYPKHIEDLFAGRTISLIGRYTHSAKGKVFVNARVGALKVRYPIQVDLPESEIRHATLAPVWGRNKIQELSSEMLSAPVDSQSNLVKQITDLAVKFRLVSQYTAFVAVDESRIVGDGKPLRVLQPVELPEGVDYAGIFGERPVGEAVRIDSWGLVLQMSETGKARVCALDSHGVAASSGIKIGAVLKSVNRVVVHDFSHLEGLLLQSAGPNLRIEFEPGNEILLPAP